VASSDLHGSLLLSVKCLNVCTALAAAPLLNTQSQATPRLRQCDAGRLDRKRMSKTKLVLWPVQRALPSRDLVQWRVVVWRLHIRAASCWERVNARHCIVQHLQIRRQSELRHNLVCTARLIGKTTSGTASWCLQTRTNGNSAGTRLPITMPRVVANG
jgi:hypothetical protein